GRPRPLPAVHDRRAADFRQPDRRTLRGRFPRCPSADRRTARQDGSDRGATLYPRIPGSRQAFHRQCAADFLHRWQRHRKSGGRIPGRPPPAPRRRHPPARSQVPQQPRHPLPGGAGGEDFCAVQGSTGAGGYAGAGVYGSVGDINGAQNRDLHEPFTVPVKVLPVSVPASLPAIPPTLVSPSTVAAELMLLMLPALSPTTPPMLLVPVTARSDTVPVAIVLLMLLPTRPPMLLPPETCARPSTFSRLELSR